MTRNVAINQNKTLLYSNDEPRGNIINSTLFFSFSQVALNFINGSGLPRVSFPRLPYVLLRKSETSRCLIDKTDVI